MTKVNNGEYEYGGLCVNGFLMLFFLFLLAPAMLAGCVYLVALTDNHAWALLAALIGLVIVVGAKGFVVQEPGMARVLIFFGRYVGTCRRVGYFWINPLLTARKLSMRLRNMDIEPIKVNDKVGNPVLIGMVLVWKIKDSYRAVFDIDSASLGVGAATIVSSGALERFVRIQSDAALREVAGHYAYDQSGSDSSELTLRDGGDATSELLENKINERLAMAGMEVVEARLNYLAYAPEIAAVMLRRQQASAIISAREKIVEGAVSMVDMALSQLEKEKVCEFTDSQKAALVSNLLVVLCADEPAQPVLPTAAG